MTTVQTGTVERHPGLLLLLGQQQLGEQGTAAATEIWQWKDRFDARLTYFLVYFGSRIFREVLLGKFSSFLQ